MASEKQIAANRLNAQHCTGPKTPAGKAISSQNALKTGLDAKSDVTHAESREAYESLIAALYAQYRPATEEERFLVDDLIRTEWLSRRYMSAATCIWDRNFEYHPKAPLGSIVDQYSQVISRIQRCISANKRDALAILRRLETLQAQEPAQPAVDAVPDTIPEKTENEPLTPQLVSFFPNAPQPAPPHPEAPDQPAHSPETTAETTPEKEKIPPLAA